MSKRKADDEIFHEYEWIPRDYRRTFVFIGMHGYRMIVVAEGRPRAGMRMRATACHDSESQRRGWKRCGRNLEGTGEKEAKISVEISNGDGGEVPGSADI